ncbi:actin cortical patch SUR7/pH-response regulator pali [Multifurca ochricompacta]|uniref:Actin cortical patch SUR7/pH-response regulator pali n=1 Tax=Multifurca ochricompacta TaxID=376703 RepID=A0AAD4M8Q0_9AGAM|nr:actin cortical patch SUR7/pH-response regulator pali [Multifurca ochricompacta]
MAASSALPGFFFCFAATVLLVLVSVSVPTWNTVYFLRASNGRSDLRFGVFGYTGTQVHIGYRLPITTGELASSSIHNLTYTLILHPVAAGLSGLALLFGLCGAGYHRSGTVLMTLSSSLAVLITLVAFVLDMVLFSIVRHEFRKLGWSSQYGNAIWMTLGALVALALGFCTSACGIFGSYRRRRQNTY